MNNPIYPFRGSNFYPIECALVNSNQQSVNLFKDLSTNTLLNPNHNTKVKILVRAIECYYADIYITAPSGRPVISQAEAKKISATFRVGNDEPIYQAPYLQFATVLNYGIIKEIAPVSINFEKSEIVVMQTLTDNTMSAMFGIWYDAVTFAEYDRVMKHMAEDKIKAIWR